MKVEGIWRKIDKVERAIAIRVALAVAIRNVDNSIDFRVVVMRLAEATWVNDYRKQIIRCVSDNNDIKSRFCCILDVLGLLNLEKKYCSQDK